MLATGRVLTANPSVKVEEIIVSDVEQMGNRKAVEFPAAAAIRIQKRVSSDVIDWERGYLELSTVLQDVTIPKP